MFTKVRQVRAFESVIQQMEAVILQGSFSVGDRLPSERELQGLMDVSRNTLRESLRVLEQKGLVEIRKGHRGGIFVKEIVFTIQPGDGSLRKFDIFTRDGSIMTTRVLTAKKNPAIPPSVFQIDETGYALEKK